MRICFITSEVFIGRRGGFGKLVRVVSRELAERGFDVYAITWREPGMKELMEVDNIKILSYPYTYTSSSTLRHVVDYSKVISLIKQVNADIYISIDCMIETFIAEKVMPHKKHIIWVQDPFDENDFKLLSSVDLNYRFNKLKFEITRIVYTLAYRKADLILTQAKYYIPKIIRLYHANPDKIVYLPNPVERIPDETSIIKAKEPTVCFLGRMDLQKRYWLFFQLAKMFPEVRFIAMGAPNEQYKRLYERIVQKYEKLENLEIKGFVSEEEKSKILSKSWILCLPSLREGLPIAFLEALAHKCALLSSVNPDNIVSKFGYYVFDNNFRRGLQALLEDDSWKYKGEYGYKYVKLVHSLDKVISKLRSIIETLHRK